ncbi:MAG: hypothetical protein HQL66_04955 [Magnetococcales bacterium]|nr:hypothetical protein [Magnetococcales bacterium]
MNEIVPFFPDSRQSWILPRWFVIVFSWEPNQEKIAPRLAPTPDQDGHGAATRARQTNTLKHDGKRATAANGKQPIDIELA